MEVRSGSRRAALCRKPFTALRRVGPSILVSAMLAAIFYLPGGAAAYEEDAWDPGKHKHAERIWVVDGSGIHNIGNLQMNVTNWGAFGSYPGSNWPTRDFPSAQWPANSGVEYLYIAGLWVGARLNGIPVVSTAAYEFEFQPDPFDTLAKIYETAEGDPRGSRLPSPPDDDRDGRADEDWLNGYDDDGDGLVDEDFTAIGKQMFSCWFTDDRPAAVQRFPEHTPLHLMVRQESYQWEDERYYDFIGVEYKIENNGYNMLEEVYIGFFADGDCGKRGSGPFYYDDATALWEGEVCARRGSKEIPIRVSIAYFYDEDGDSGDTPGYFGVLFLGHDVDPLGRTAPRSVGITSYQNFSGSDSYENGGDPTNDEQRYSLMSKGRKDRNATDPADYRMLMAVGPFEALPPESTMVLQVAFVCGEGLEGMKENAAAAALVYKGNWFDVDDSPLTGVDGRETPIYGPVEAVVVDSCADSQEIDSATRGEIVWINADCREEIASWNNTNCSRSGMTFKDYQTGVDGRETRVSWLGGSAPPPPHLRVVPGHNHVSLFWDDFSEVTPDVSTLELDFEGFRVWRADGWDRPVGTTVLSGPERKLWHLLEERDLVNGVGPDVDFKRPFAQGGWAYEPLAYMEEKDQLLEFFKESLRYFPMDAVPCPPGLTDEQCDTLEALARYELGFEGGRRYYRYIDRNIHDGMHYFYSVVAYDHFSVNGVPFRPDYYGDPMSNFVYITAVSDAQESDQYDRREVYVVPNPATAESMEPWRLEPNMSDPTGIKVEFRNLPKCRSTVRIYTVAGDLVEILHHDGRSGGGTLVWELVSRNGQDVTSGIYLFSVEAENADFARSIGKFVVIR